MLEIVLSLIHIAMAILFLYIVLLVYLIQVAKEMVRVLPRHEWFTQADVRKYGFSYMFIPSALVLLQCDRKIMTKAEISPTGEQNQYYMILSEVLTDARGRSYIQC